MNSFSDSAATLRSPPVTETKSAGTLRRLLTSKSAKRFAALAVLAAGLYALGSEELFVASDAAVVSSYTVALRTPIEGVVHGLAVTVGATVARAATLARVENDRVDDQRLNDLLAANHRAEADLASTEAARAVLERLRGELARRVAAHQALVAAREQAALAGASGQAEAASAARAQARVDLGRKSRLAQAGFAAPAEIDKLRTALLVASHQEETAQATAEMAGIEEQAARAGIQIGPGDNDVSYSTQRGDEVDIRLAELDRAIADARAAREATAAEIAAERARLARLAEATLKAPLAGMVWKLGAAEGERIASGEMVAELVDCDSPFVIAAIPQSRFSDIAVGQQVKFRLTGDGAEQHGQVISVTGAASLTQDRNLAAVPVARPSSVTVWIRPDRARGQSGECLIGRTAHVLIPTGITSAATRLIRAVF
jgi:multidrug resistance efflux pump